MLAGMMLARLGSSAHERLRIIRCRVSPGMRHDREALEMVNIMESDTEILDRLFSMFDKTGNDQLNYKEFVSGLAPLCHGTVDEILACECTRLILGRLHQAVPESPGSSRRSGGLWAMDPFAFLPVLWNGPKWASLRSLALPADRPSC